MRGATTMKMMSNTRTTSTSGVTFMSGVTAPDLRALGDPLMADSLTLYARLLPVLDHVEQLARRALQDALVARDRGREIVEGEHGRDRDRETEGGLDQG